MNNEDVNLFPLSMEEEQHQLRMAIMMSLQDSTRADEEKDGDDEEQKEIEPFTSSFRPTTYARANTTIQVQEKHSRPIDISPQMLLRRSMSIGNGSPPRPSQLTDCCEVKNALLAKDREYIKCMVASWGRVTSPLHAAVRKGHDYCLEPLLKAFPDLINSTNSNGETPLYLAAIHSKPRALQQLLQFQADPNIGRSSQETPLLAAVDNDHREIAINLIKGGADVNKPLNRGWTVLHEAVYRGHSEILGILLRHGGNPNTRDGFGISPVFTSAACGRNECLKLLLRTGGNPNICARSKSASPLYEACKEGHADCVHTLLEHGANPHLVNCDGLYPLHIASYRGHKRIVKELLPITDREMAQACGMSPIHSAAKGDHVNILEMLIEQGYDVNIKLTKDKITYRDRRQTALFFAVYNDSEEATELLLDAGANTELDYIKPLLVAVSHSQYEMTDLLLAYGADVNANFNEDGAMFPAAIAFALKDFRMLKQVLISGCDVEKCLNCEMGNVDHTQFEDDIQRKSFCHFITEEQNGTWCGCNVLFLLKFAGNTKLCDKIINAARETDEWPAIKVLTDNPRSLQHLCRMNIRKSFGKRELRKRQTLDQLPLPPTLIDYLMFSEI